MRLNEYQAEAEKTAIYPEEQGLLYTLIGLTGEAGEVLNKYKKTIRDKQDLTEDIAQELGDVLWYVAMVAKELGYSLEDIAKKNIDVLSSRQERGTLHGSGDDR